MDMWIHDTTIYTILFADDQIVFAEDQQNMFYMINKLTEEILTWKNTVYDYRRHITGHGKKLE